MMAKRCCFKLGGAAEDRPSLAARLFLPRLKIVNSRRSFSLTLLMVSLLALARAGCAQSTDQALPTPVLANEINGRIPALDLGDARLTRHFYAFEGTPGDLLITIDSKNLNGDMDVFTAVTFRPLMKTTLYANSRTGAVTKGLYLRAHQILILRVEARTPNDDEGSYHVRFGGSFASFSGGIPVAENTETPEDRPNRDSQRLSSVGATIAQPVVETPPATAAPTPAAATEKPADETAAAKTVTPAKPGRPRPGRPTSTRRNTRERAPAKPAPAPSDTEAAKTSTAKTEAAKTEPDTPAKPESAKPETQELPPPGAHLIIESKDGTKIDRPMSTVRRVVVEGGMIVIVLKTGKVERVLMSTVSRMAIEP